MATTRQEAETMERRLRPVYDAIENGQHKKAIQLVEKALKKTPDLNCAKALKAIALLRLGRGDEARDLINKVIQTRPGDGATLQAVCWYCREVGDYNKMVELYEGAAQVYPKNEEILTQLFMAYVRVGAYQKQQQAAIQLTKQFTDNGPYYCWRVMSILVLAHTSTPDKQQLLLTLAERLMDKFVSDDQVDNEAVVAAEVRLYMMILRNLGKTEKCLEVIKGKLGAKLRNPDELLTHELGCLHKLSRWEEMAVMIPPLLEADADQWTYTKLYVTAQLNRGLMLRQKALGDNKENTENTETAVAVKDENEEKLCRRPLQEAKQFLEKLIGGESSPRRVCRSPHLGLLELAAQSHRHKLQMDDSSLQARLLMYFKQFSSKLCCFDDIKLFFNELSPKDTTQVLQAMAEVVAENEINFDCSDEEIRENANRLCRLITLTQLQRFAGTHSSLSVKEKRDLVKRFMRMFEAGVRFGQHLPSTVNQLSDFFALVSGHLLIEIYRETGSCTDLWECAVLLEAARKYSSTNPDIQLLLWRLYAFLGPVELCTQLYNNLAIKHIQIDTVGYLINSNIQSMGAFGFASQLYRLALRFYLGCPRETADYITTGYKNGVFHKIIEMIDLREQLSHSMCFYDICVRMLIQETIMMEMNSMEKAREFFLGNEYHNSLPTDPSPNTEDFTTVLRDNRDMRVLDDWSPPDQLLLEEDIKQSFQAECLWVKVRVVIVQCLQKLVAMATPNTTPTAPTCHNDCQCNGEVSNDVFAGLEQVLSKAGAHPALIALQSKKCHLLPLQAPPSCQLALFLRLGYGTLLVKLFKMAAGVLQRAPDEPLVTVENDLKEAMASLREVRSDIIGFPSDVRELLKRVVSSCQQDKESDDLEGILTYDNHPYKRLLQIKLDIEPYVLLLTVISCVLVACSMCVSHLKPSSTKRKKKHKAAAASNAPPTGSEVECASHFLSFLRDLHSLLQSLAADFSPLPSVEGEAERKLAEVYSTGREPEILEETPLVKTLPPVEVKICRGIIESYNTSFGDCIQVVKGKMAFIAALVKQLGGGVLESSTV